MDNFKPNSSMLINTLNITAVQCMETMELIQKNRKITSCLIAYHILASTCLELFPKIKLLKRYTKQDMSTALILDIFLKFGHNLDKIYSKKEIGPDFLSAPNIKRVKEIKKDNIIYCYDFYLNNSKTIIRAYDPESLKYWLLSKRKSNFAVVGYQSNELLELCKNVQEAAYNDDIV